MFVEEANVLSPIPYILFVVFYALYPIFCTHTVGRLSVGSSMLYRGLIEITYCQLGYRVRVELGLKCRQAWKIGWR